MPFQGFAAAAGICLSVGHHHDVAAIDEDHADHMSMGHEGSVDTLDHVTISSEHDQDRHAGAGDHHHHAVDKCGVCSACCASAAILPQALVVVSAVHNTAGVIPFRPAAMNAAYLASLERPPKLFLI